jgi:lysophospholipase L1-like esterase
VLKRLALSLLVTAALGLLALAPGAARAAAGPPYYLSLGDSLAQGVQPNASGQSQITDQGYADDLYSLARARTRGLRLEKLGCPDETTTSMIDGGVCNGAYAPFDDQLDAAVAFLETHDVAFVTIDIGANDVDGCLAGETVDPVCIANGIQTAGSNLPKILSALRAADPTVPIIGMNYYDPFLASWLQGPAGQALALQSLALTLTFNGVLEGAYARFSIPVANVQDAFQTTNRTEIPFVQLPVDVAAICSLTWMCAPAPVGPNIHANALGYWVIAGAFTAAGGRL